MKQTILLLTLLVSTLGMACDFKGPYDTMSGISQEELDMTESVGRDQEYKFQILSFKVAKIMANDLIQNYPYITYGKKVLFELSENHIKGYNQRT